MSHAVLLGDSIFDNARYVPDRPPVIEQVRHWLPQGWLATLLAVDGHQVDDVANQISGLPAGATHLFVSAGGNDALGEINILAEPCRSVGEAMGIMQDVRTRFRRSYCAMLDALSAVGKPAAVCTVYDAVPGLGPAEKAALAGFNEVILYEAFAAGLPVIDLRLVCNQPSDFSHVSSIEPSMTGGAKIARLIAEIATTHEFRKHRSAIYV